MKIVSNCINKILNVVTTIIIILLFISVIASFQTTFFGKKYNSFFGYSLFEIKTASMAGVMEIGDWILVKITDDVKLDDIVTFEQDGSFITHRIIEQYQDTYITKGDSNNAKDTPITKNQIVGKMIKVIPKFGIMKKTLFNTKVLITLIITILVGTTLFDKNSIINKKSKSPIIKSKPKKEEIDEEFFNFEELNKIEKENTIDNKTIEKIEKKIEEHIEERKKIQKEEEKELSNTMVLSRIVVDMNSKALSTISKHLEDTVVLEPVEVPQENKKKEIPIKNISTNKKILLGKNEKNLIRKCLELKEIEITELTKILLNVETLEGETRALVNKFINIYLEQKYINQGYLDKNTSVISFRKDVANNIIKYSEILANTKNIDNYKNKVNKITEVFLIINKIDSSNANIEKIIDTLKNYDSKKTVKEIKKVIKQFESNIASFCKKLSTSKFDLLIKNSPKENLYKTNISSNIQFNKLFSNYSIDKTYQNEVINEDLRELQLKMLSLTIIQDMFSFSYKKKYLITLSDTIFGKEKKIKSFLGNMDDIYSQGKINILIDIKTLIMNYNVISELNKNGYQFSVEIECTDLDEIKNIRKYLCIGEYIFIKNNNLSDEELMDKIPLELENRIVNIEKSLIEGPVIK